MGVFRRDSGGSWAGTGIRPTYMAYMSMEHGAKSLFPGAGAILRVEAEHV